MSNPPITLYGSAYPVAKAALDALSTLLRKGQETAGADDLPAARLYGNMSPLTTQVQYVCNILRNLVGRTTGEDLSGLWEEAAPLATWADMEARVAAARAFVEAADEEVVNAKANETFTMVTNTYGTVHLCTHAWVSTYILPYLFFYLVTTYGILRKEGVPLQLMDYMGPFNNILKDSKPV